MKLQILPQIGLKILVTSTEFLRECGFFLIFLANALSAVVKLSRYYKFLSKQLIIIGYCSLPIVALTAIFTGSVLAIQGYIGFAKFNPEFYIANLLTISITREIGPVLVGLVVTGRIGASIAAELATMQVTEQIDALRSLTINPYNYIIAPRILAGVIAFPLLVLATDILGIYGGYLTGVYKLGFDKSLFIKNILESLSLQDISSGVVKGAIFGLIATTTSCYCGYTCSGGARGVGIATTKSVVISFVIILLANYLATLLFFYGK